MVSMEYYRGEDWVSEWRPAHTENLSPLELRAQFIQVPDELFRRWLIKQGELAEIEREFDAIEKAERPAMEQAREELIVLREQEALALKAKQDACIHDWVLVDSGPRNPTCLKCKFEDWHGKFSSKTKWWETEVEDKPNSYDPDELPRWDVVEWWNYLEKESK